MKELKCDGCNYTFKMFQRYITMVSGKTYCESCFIDRAVYILSAKTRVYGE